MDVHAVLASEYNLQRLVLPNLIARWLLKQGFRLSFANQTFDMRLVPLMSRRYIAELISEPIITESDAYSYVMQFWLDPLSDREKPILFQKTRVRRWRTDKVFIKWNRSKSMYLRRQAGYLETAHRQDIFTRITVRNFGGRNIDYVGKQADVYRLIPIGGSVPNLEDFLANPRQHQTTALMPMENRNAKSSSGIGIGIRVWRSSSYFQQTECAVHP